MAPKVWVAMSRVLRFVTDWFRRNVREILQNSVNTSGISELPFYNINKGFLW